jgi:hypothetical protein
MWRPRSSDCNLVSATKTFSQIFMIFGTGVTYKMSVMMREFRENRSSDSHTLRRGVN